MKKLITLFLSITLLMSAFACTPPKSSENSVDNSNNHPSSSTSSYNEDSTPDYDATELEISLNKTNTPNASDIKSSFNHTIDGIEFIYTNVTTAEDDAHITLQKAGSLTNLTPIGDLRTVTINYDFAEPNSIEEQNQMGFGYLKYRIGRNYVDNPNDYGTLITTTGKDVVIDLSKESNDFFISFWSPRVVTINSIDFVYAEDEYTPYYSDFTIQVFSTNDIHGQVNPSAPYYPGLSKLTANMQSIAAKNDQFNIFLDQGDIYQGTAEAGLTNGYNMDDFLLANGYESTTLGNHEFDWGEQRIKDHVEYSSVAILANNVRYTKDNSSPEWAIPYKLISRNGVKIGVIGSLGDVRSSISASKIEGITFLTGDALTEQIKADSRALKEMGADFIILSIHDGNESSSRNGVSSLPYYNISQLSKTYVDLVLESHTHQRYKFYDSKGVWHLQNYSNGSTFFVSKLNCSYKNGDYEVSLTTADAPVYYSSTTSKNDPILDEIDNWYNKNVYGKIQSEVVGKSVPYMSDSDFEDLTAKLYYDYGMEMTKGTPYEIVLGGGFLKTRTPYDLSGGTVKYGDLYNLLPFDNDLVLCSVSGSDLKSKFLQTSNSDYHVYASITATQIANNKTYYILTDVYTSDYSYNNLTVVANYSTKNSLFARDLMAKHLKSKYL